MESIFSDYVSNLGRALGLNPSDILKLNEILRRFSDTDKFKLVNNTEETVRKLIEVDKKINLGTFSLTAASTRAAVATPL